MKNYLLFSALFTALLFVASFNSVSAAIAVPVNSSNTSSNTTTVNNVKVTTNSVGVSGIKVSITATPILPPTQPQTVVKFTYNFTKNLTVGSKGADVLEMQKLLNAKGFLKTDPVGEFGPMTLDAVKAFQTANSIPSTGFVGPMTLKALNDLNK